jgi:hypothetical protein
VDECKPLPPVSVPNAATSRSSETTSREGHWEQVHDRIQSMAYLECECSNSLAEEEEEIQRRSSVCSRYPPCHGVFTARGDVDDAAHAGAVSPHAVAAASHPPARDLHSSTISA